LDKTDDAAQGSGLVVSSAAEDFWSLRMAMIAQWLGFVGIDLQQLQGVML